MSGKIRERIFIVGCPRSGTTLLQNILAAHEEIITFPETHFLPGLLIDRPFFKRLPFGLPFGKSRMRKILTELKSVHLMKSYPLVPLMIKPQVTAFYRILDTMAEEKNCTIWIEKTPRHLHYISIIERLVPDAKFIHIVRNGEDVVASLYETTHKYPKDWRGAKSIQWCVERWNSDISISERYLSGRNHSVIRYRDILDKSEVTVRSLCAFLDIEYSEKMLRYQEVNRKQMGQTILSNEKWKESVAQGIQRNQRRKFDSLFQDDEKEWIARNVKKSVLFE